jgi:hypothetical protein
MQASSTAAAELLRKARGELESQIVGRSMVPTLPDGSRIRISCGQPSVARGDIVAILAEPPVAHRVVAVHRFRARTYLVTRGDAAWHCDVPVGEQDILGVVTAHNDGHGWKTPAEPPGTRGLRRALEWLSARTVVTALALSDRLASLAARAGATAAMRWRLG